MVVKGNSQVVVSNGAFVNNGSFSAGDGTVVFAGAADSSKSYISGSASTTFNNLGIQKQGSNVTTRVKAIVTDTLSVSSGYLYSNNYLVLNSDSSGTAMVNSLPVNGSGVATAGVQGNVSVERYIPARKAWRLLAAPLASGAQSISAAWQESSTTSSTTTDPNPGYGTHITGGTVALGYDQGPTPNTSIKIYNAVSNGWTGLGAGGTIGTSITDHQGYFLYVRGGRSVNLPQGVNLTPSNTRLRMSGQLRSGNQVIPVNASNFTVVGNPYASPIDFHSILKTNVGDKVYIWDPKMSGQYGLGAYVTLSWNENTSAYDMTSSVSPVSQYIASGEAFIVTSLNGTSSGSLTIRESDKKNGGSDQTFRINQGEEQKIRIDLYKVNATNADLLDGALVTYADNYQNLVDEYDAIKPFGSGELIGLLRQGKTFSIERRKSITSTDTVYLQQSQMRIGNYRMVIELSNMASPGMTAFLVDKTVEGNPTVLDINNLNTINYAITTVAATYDPFRFYIVFKNLTVVPVRFISMNASPRENDIRVQWKVDNQVNIKNYIIEKSVDGINYFPMSSVDATQASDYSGIDNNPLKGKNFYRIKAYDQDGSFLYSETSMVDWKKAGMVFVYPNPVEGKIINITLDENSSGWNYRLINNSGETIIKGAIKKGMFKYKITLPATVSSGAYDLEMIAGDNTRRIVTLFIN